MEIKRRCEPARGTGMVANPAEEAAAMAMMLSMATTAATARTSTRALRSAGQTVSFIATLSGQHPHAGKKVSNAEDARAFGSITLHSHGGHGGPGGHGGHGAVGVIGYAGRDATRESPDGGPGGPGGNAGSEAGRRPWRQRRPNCGAGGVGARLPADGRQRSGRAGRLGARRAWRQEGAERHAGRGRQRRRGRACHWTTQRQEWRTEHYQDEEGKKQSRQVQVTVTDHHHQLGGRNGPRARAARRASGNPAGRRPARTAASPYPLAGACTASACATVTHFDVADGRACHALGGGRRDFRRAVCHAQRISLANKSARPIWGPGPPPQQRVRVHILENGWVARKPSTVDAFCAQSIQEGSKAPCDGFASFEIKYDPRSDFRAAWPMDQFAAHDLGLNAVADSIRSSSAWRWSAIASQLGVEDVACSGSHTRFHREYLDSHHGYAIPEVQFRAQLRR